MLKIDCEGCEYGVAEQVLLKHPTFFNHVGQVVLEAHFPAQFSKDRDTAMQFPKLVYLLEQAGLKTQPIGLWGSCGRLERAGCAPLLNDFVRCKMGTPPMANRICPHLLFHRDDYDPASPGTRGRAGSSPGSGLSLSTYISRSLPISEKGSGAQPRPDTEPGLKHTRKLAPLASARPPAAAPRKLAKDASYDAA